jgi:glycosyltransferase involved in cell wall biosynthesis
MKVYALPAEEGWICDQLVDDWKKHSGMACDDPREADVIWLLSDWRWRSLPMSLLATKKVVTTVHHIVPKKFDKAARMDFAARDAITTLYHVYNQRAYDFVRPLTKRPIQLVPYWANQELWRPTGTKAELRRKLGLPENEYLIGSFQRDTEGHDLKSPKLEKGPDLFVDFVSMEHPAIAPHVVLAGWRRQYVIGRLEAADVPYTYFERPPQSTLVELYQTLDLYAVTARYEGGPQSLLECGLLNVPMVCTPVGIAEQVLPLSAIDWDVSKAVPAVPNVESMKLPHGMDPYKKMFEGLK